jgi:hypothetical protein
MAKKYSKERLEEMTDEELDNLLMGEMFLMKEREKKMKQKVDAVKNIHKAIREGDVELFRENVKLIDINKKLFNRPDWEDNDYPDYDVMEFLSQQIYYREDKERYTYTKKYDGNIDSDIEMMKIVLDMGYDINQEGDYKTNKSLYLSILHNSTKVFKFLIDNGARYIANAGGLTSEHPIYQAARNKNREMMDILLSIGIEDTEWGGYTAEQSYQKQVQYQKEREEREKSMKSKKSLHYKLMAENEEYERLVLRSMNFQSPMMSGGCTPWDVQEQKYSELHSDIDRIKEIFEKETGEEVLGIYHDRQQFIIE